MKTFENKVVWITGASSGFGEALAYKFAAEGAKIILSAKSIDKLENVKSRIKNSEILPLDLAERNTFQLKTEKAFSLFGTIDIIIHNAAIAQSSTVIEIAPEIERKIMEIDYLVLQTSTDISYHILLQIKKAIL